MSAITTHVLDTSRGRPAGGIAASLERRDADAWSTVGGGITDDDGRVGDLLPADHRLRAGRYRITFETGRYYDRLAEPTLYPRVSIEFEVSAPDEHYHVPLLLSPFGYSTYRGS